MASSFEHFYTQIFVFRKRREISWLSDSEEGLGCPHDQSIEYHSIDTKDKFIPVLNFYAMKTCGGLEVCVHACLTFALVEDLVTSHPAKDSRVSFDTSVGGLLGQFESGSQENAEDRTPVCELKLRNMWLLWH